MNILQKRIQEASQKYYSDGTSDLTDAEFDSLLDQLREEEPDSPLLGVGHGYEVDKDSTDGERVPHIYAVAGSLDKCHNWKEVRQEFKGTEIWASMKIDGLSMVIYYTDGKFTRALTRGGNGITGIDVTEKIRQLVPESVGDNFTGSVRGEVVMSEANFTRYKELHPEAKNARNTAAGIVNTLGVSPDISFLSIVVYSVTGSADGCSVGSTYYEVWEWLCDNFDHVAPYTKIKISAEEEMSTMDRLRDEWYGEYPADGIVLSLDPLTICPGLVSGNQVVYSSIAFKFKAESDITEVIGIEWNLTRSRYLVPRVNVKTVQLSGTNVCWATGFNAKNIIDKQLGSGAVVKITKSGEIIPFIEEVIKPGSVAIPSECFCCGSTLAWSGVHLKCENAECSDAGIQDALVWISHISPTYGLGDTLISSFLLELLGNDVSVEEIYGHGMISEAEISEETSVKKKQFMLMFNSLFTNKVSLSDAIQALNIPRLGDVNSDKLAQYGHEVKLLSEGVISDSICIGYANFESIKENIEKFKKLQFISDNIEWHPLKKKTRKVAVTGKLSVPRKEFEKLLATLGFEIGSVCKQTEFLITDDPNSNSEKNVKADKLGVPKLTEAQFRETILRN